MQCYICKKQLICQVKYRACDKTDFLDNWHWVCDDCKDKIIGDCADFPFLDFEMVDESLYDKGER